jgi:CRP-like cAMP-binding protein
VNLDDEGFAAEDFYGELNQGDYFGELGLFFGHSKSMTAWCI